jgi:hypothetical protein
MAPTMTNSTISEVSVAENHQLGILDTLNYKLNTEYAATGAYRQEDEFDDPTFYLHQYRLTDGSRVAEATLFVVSIYADQEWALHDFTLSDHMPQVHIAFSQNGFNSIGCECDYESTMILRLFNLKDTYAFAGPLADVFQRCEGELQFDLGHLPWSLHFHLF